MRYRHDPCRWCSSAQNLCGRITAIVFLFVVLAAINLEAQSPSAQSLSVKPTGTTGSIGGLVTDPNGNAVVGAKIWAIRTFSAVAVSAPVATTEDTNAQGIYLFPGLAPASYRICVSAEGAMLLDPCTWSANPPVWNLEVGQTAAVNLALARGVFVHVHIDDPGGAVAKEVQSGNPFPVMMSGASSSGPRIHFREVVSGATGQTFRALTRNGDTVQVQIGTDLKVIDKLGNPVSSSTAVANPTPVSVVGGGVEQTVVLKVQ
jgi:hypothetical protein